MWFGQHLMSMSRHDCSVYVKFKKILRYSFFIISDKTLTWPPVGESTVLYALESLLGWSVFWVEFLWGWGVLSSEVCYGLGSSLFVRYLFLPFWNIPSQLKIHFPVLWPTSVLVHPLLKVTWFILCQYLAHLSLHHLCLFSNSPSHQYPLILVRLFLS